MVFKHPPKTRQKIFFASLQRSQPHNNLFMKKKKHPFHKHPILPSSKKPFKYPSSKDTVGCFTTLKLRVNRHINLLQLGARLAQMFSHLHLLCRFHKRNSNTTRRIVRMKLLESAEIHRLLFYEERLIQIILQRLA